jgi:hypothetical protein
MNYDAVYASDGAFPESQGELTGAGTLRKYAYAAVSFCPFRYSPNTGALEFYTGATITVDYSLPNPGSNAARRQTLLMRDTAADKRAQRLFANFSDIRGLYDVSLGDAAASQQEVQVAANYLIITTPDLITAVGASNFISWKESLGFAVEPILTTDIRIIARPGVDLAEKIRNFLRDVYASWGVEYVLIVGSPSAVPMRYCFADANNHVNNAGVPNASSGEVPADHYYADLSSPDATSWDLDGDGYYGEWGHDAPDFMAEVFVGRIPTIDPAKVTYTLDKLVRYEQDTGTWKHHALHAGAFAWFENEDHSGRALKDLATCIDSIETGCMGSWTIEHFSEQIGVQKSVYPWTLLSGVAFMNAWADGQFGVVNWGGHGWSDGVYGKYWSWDDGDGVAETAYPEEIFLYRFLGTTSFLEDDYPSIVFTLSCLVGYPEPNLDGNLGVDLLTKPEFGAAAGIVNGTRVIWVSKGGGETHCYEFNRHLIDGPSGAERVGEALFDSKQYVYQTYSWNHFAEYWNMYSINFYGDPAMDWEGIAVVSGVEDNERAPAVSHLGKIFPNPFNPETTIPFELGDGGFVNLSVYSVDGSLVKTLINKPHEAGRHKAVWRGTNNRGEPVASGTYFCRIRVGSYSETRRMTLLK